MRLLRCGSDFTLTKDLLGDDLIPPYAILSHTWEQGQDEELTFEDMINGGGRDKTGFNKIRFCEEQARRDGLRFYWVDSCCINKADNVELQDAINSMFRWYQNATKSYVYLSDVSWSSEGAWRPLFRESRWFTRGWTLQELLAPHSVAFFSREEQHLGNKQDLDLQQLIHEITGIPIPALGGSALQDFDVEERLSWTKGRQTTRKEDKAYSLMGIFGVYMPLIYGEGEKNAFRRLREEITKYLENSWRDIATTNTAHVFLVDSLPHDASKFEQNTIRAIRSYVEPPGRSNAPRRSIDPVVSTKEQAIGAVTSLVEDTQHAAILGDLHHHRGLTQIYRELRKCRELLEHVAQISETAGSRGWPRSRTQSEAITSNNDTKGLDSDAVDIFFDCISRYSDDESDHSLDRSCARFSGPLENFLERSPDFLAEQYVSPGRFNGSIILLTMIEVGYTSTYRLQKYCLFFAENPRSWHRVTVSATIITSSQKSGLAWIASSDFNRSPNKTLPGNLKSELERILKDKSLKKTATNMSLIISELGLNSFSIDASHASITEDVMESGPTMEAELLRRLEEVECAIVVQKEIVVKKIIAGYSSIVQVGSQIFFERKLPFAGTNLSSKKVMTEEGKTEFLNDINHAYALHRCTAVLNLRGVVLDKTKTHIQSYLVEWPVFGSLEFFFSDAERSGQTISWAVRQTWARQIVAAVAEVHRRGIVHGMLTRFTIFIRKDGKAVLGSPRPSRRVLNQRGRLAPELRSASNCAPSYDMMTFQTDIFQLGLVLWHLADHQMSTANLCRRFACTKWPPSSCTEHYNPVELPPSDTAVVPEYMNKIISYCRLRSPALRPSASELLQYFPEEAKPMEMADLLVAYANREDDGHWMICDNCGDFITSFYSQCNACQAGSFHLCSSCISKGIHCFVPEHVLIKRDFSKEDHDM